MPLLKTPVILISDDDPPLVACLARMIRRAGLSFISDTTSESVHALAKTHRPDLILLDINQPTDGRDILARLKKDPATRDIKVLVLSAIDDQYTRHVCFELGAIDYAVKPFDVTLIGKIRHLLELPPEQAATA